MSTPRMHPDAYPTRNNSKLMHTCESSAPLEIIDAPVPHVSHGDGTRSGKAKYRANIAHASTATEIDPAVITARRAKVTSLSCIERVPNFFLQGGFHLCVHSDNNFISRFARIWLLDDELLLD